MADVEKALDNLKSMLKTGSPEELSKASDQLQELSLKLGQHIYEQAKSAGSSTTGNGSTSSDQGAAAGAGGVQNGRSAHNAAGADRPAHDASSAVTHARRRITRPTASALTLALLKSILMAAAFESAPTVKSYGLQLVFGRLSV